MRWVTFSIRGVTEIKVSSTEMELILGFMKELLIFSHWLLVKKIFFLNCTVNKIGLQPVEQVHYFGRWVEGTKSLWCQDFADRQTYNGKVVTKTTLELKV